MAFGGILLFNVLLWFVLGSALIGLACIIAAIVLSIIHFNRKRKETPHKKWLPIAAVILTIAGVLTLLPITILILISA